MGKPYKITGEHKGEITKLIGDISATFPDEVKIAMVAIYPVRPIGSDDDKCPVGCSVLGTYSDPAECTELLKWGMKAAAESAIDNLEYRNTTTGKKMDTH